LFRHSHIPRYVQLADVMRGRIHRGQWLPNNIIPSIEELMSEFDAARVTVRQAVKMLSEEGLLSPQRGRGTFVTQAPGRNRKLVVETTLDELVKMYSGDKPDLSNVIESDLQPELTNFDGVAAAHYTHMRRVHSRDAEPYCYVSIYIDDKVFAIAPERFRSEVVLPLITSLPDIEITAARQTLKISTADVEVAQNLDIALGAPVAEVRRVLVGRDGIVLYLGEATYRGDYIRLEMDLKPRG